MATARRPERRSERRRGITSLYWDPLFRALRASAGQAATLRATLGVFLLGGIVVATVGTAAFAWMAAHVRAGTTQAFDDSVLRWMAGHQSPDIEAAALEVTFLGTGLVVLVIVGVAATFLYLTSHKYSAALLLASTGGGIILNNVLKFGFGRPRPQLFAWGTHVVSSSFPSGHAMSAAVVYGTVAYLAARLQERRWARAITLCVAAVFIALISMSRLYLGVHYPSDVIAGVFIGLAWAAFCMVTLEALQRYAMRRPSVRKDEEIERRRA
ncbi:MAG TPA: phosphatase PAP2 family protein [Gemmatimonadaceae bacterium]|nr:phosphatase PAP2 family protein [Gemmatimonadaceae bacterium]